MEGNIDMDVCRSKKLRTATRSAFTRIFNSLKDELSKESCNLEEAQGKLCLLESKLSDLRDLDKVIVDWLLDKDDAVSELDEDIRVSDEYIEKFNHIKIIIDNKLSTPLHKLSSKDCESDSVVSRPFSDNSKKKMKLPSIEFNKFSGDLKEWLPFWGQFQRIDEDGDIDDIDKFQYLLQATVPHSRARKIVESYPPIGKNYTNAVKSLKARFGRDDLLIEVYVRELLKLVLTNLSSKVVLASLYDKMESQLRSLETLGVTSDKFAAMLYPLVESCLPEEVLRAWQRHSTFKTDADLKLRLEGLMEFLRKEVDNEERIALAISGFGNKNKPNTTSNGGKQCSMQSSKMKSECLPTASDLINHKSDRPVPTCAFCNCSNHETANCRDTKNLSVDDKIKLLTKGGCCFLCTKFGHTSKKCRVRLSCSICKGRHVTIMCKKDTGRSSVKSDNEPIANENVLANNVHNGVFLQTLAVQIRGKKKDRRVRAIIDTGSQHSYILKGTAQEMEYDPVRKQKLIHNLFGGSNTDPIEHTCYRARVSNIDKSYACNFEVLDQDVICSNVSHVKRGPWMAELLKSGILISDTSEGPIELLIGADIAGKLLTDQRKVLECGLVAVGTHLGWTLMGKIPSADICQNNSMVSVTTSMFINNKPLASLWELDAIGIEDPVQRLNKEEEELALRDHFMNSVSVGDDGHYQVHMPWIEGHPPLPTNINVAKKRLESTVSKLRKNNRYKDYDNVFKEWESEKIIEEVPFDNNCLQEGHYLPHRPVYKENSTTRVRPVFDASAREYNQPSLNDCLSKGINLIELIPSIILRFRLNEIGVVSDIKKAFLQISLSESDRDFVRFLWLDDSGRMKIYRHRRVVFGVSCSPFLLGAVINYHLEQEIERDSSVYSKSILNQLQHSFYVDNCIASVGSKEQLNTFIKEASAIFSDAKFELRGWEFTDKDISPEVSSTPLLGMLWNRGEDIIKINMSHILISDDCDSNIVTKRKILSVTHKVFDILGLSCPTTLFPKILLQKTWELKLTWDEEVTSDIKSAFLKWHHELPHLSQIQVPRWFSGDVSKWSLHTFCDASLHAYAAVIFLRVELNSAVVLHFVEAKTRVAPVKKHSIPRLELLAANIAARLTCGVKKNIDLPDLPTTFWSDSSTVISWIQREDCWTTFVWNRTQEIRKLTPKESWRHVPGPLNPADLASRGCSPKELLKSKWWEGPEWLKLPEERWPEMQFTCKEDDIAKEKKKGVVSSFLSTDNGDYSWYYVYFSKYEKIVRMIAWILRFRNNCKNKESKISGALNLQELQTAELAVIKMVQQESFIDASDNKLKSLCPYLDQNGLIRLKTKLDQREDSEYFRVPVVLPSKHPVVQMLIYDQHVKHCHVGVQGLLSLLREKFWIVNGRRTIRSVIGKCVKCFKLKSKNFEAEPIYLPKDRVRDTACFEVCGVDFAGPLFLNTGEKAYICLFTCAFYRAVHMELVSSLSTSEFIQALRRFIARRGRISVIYSDNGTNFVGTKNLLDKIDWNKINEYSTVERFEWRFNPPTAAWWGGWWERVIGLTKQLLRKTLGKSSLSYEEMSTVLCDCEALLNARPLTYVSEDKEDLVPITPSMYLTDIKELGTPDLDSLESNPRLLKRRHRYLQRLRNSLRQRFRSEYLGLLMVKPKKKTRSVKKGEVVIIQTENKKRHNWPLAVIEELIPGRDGNVRLVKLRTGSSRLMRPIQKIFPLEVQSTETLC